MKVLVIAGSPRSLYNFRGDLIQELMQSGHEVVAAAAQPEDSIRVEIEKLGCKFVTVPIERSGLNPVSDFRLLIQLIRLMKSEQPNLVFSYTIKPIIWGGIASKLFRSTRFYGLVTGLGFAFQKGGVKRNLLNAVVRVLYKFALHSANGVIFQNLDNRDMFLDQGIVQENKTFRVHGSGVNTQKFAQKAGNVKEGEFVFLSIARLLKEKGIYEYVEAARIVKAKYPSVTCQLLGAEDPSPDGISIEEIKKMHDSGVIEYLGWTNDVRPCLEASSVFVLASYHEGLPRTSLEAMSIGRPVLTTNAVGCRDTVVEGENGFCVPVGDSNSLAQKMIWFIENTDRIPEMGAYSRRMVLEKFDVQKVNKMLIGILGLSEEK